MGEGLAYRRPPVHPPRPAVTPPTITVGSPSTDQVNGDPVLSERKVSPHDNRPLCGYALLVLMHENVPMGHVRDDSTANRGIRAFVTPQQWAVVCRLGSGVSYRAREVMLRQGDTGSTVLLFLSGRAKVFYGAPDGSQTLLSIRGPGDVVGEVACTVEEPRTATVQALEEVRVRVIPFGEFTDAVKKFGCGRPLQRYWTDRFRQAYQDTWRIAGQTPARRIAALFVAMMDAGGEGDWVPMTQEEIAVSFGLSRRTIGVILRKWQEEGIVTVRRSRVDILCRGRIRSILPDGM